MVSLHPDPLLLLHHFLGLYFVSPLPNRLLLTSVSTFKDSPWDTEVDKKVPNINTEVNKMVAITTIPANTVATRPDPAQI